MIKPGLSALVLAVVVLSMIGCAAAPGVEARRAHDEIMVAGRLFHTGAPVVLWTDPGGYDGYRVERRFVPFADAGWDKSKDAIAEPSRYNLRYQKTAAAAYTPDELERVRGGGWDLELLRSKVDQFVIHYDVCGTSRTCFRVLHDQRGLSVHFMLDIDGTIYQTLDLKERAWHATLANDRSIGIEIANIGAYPAGKTQTLEKWYTQEADAKGRVTRARIMLPPELGDGGVRTPGFVGYSARAMPVTGMVQGQELVMYDLTPQQYRSLIKLTAALCRVFPQIGPVYPRDDQGSLIPRQLTSEQWQHFKGVLGHYHVQENKTDPGPAFDWERYMNGVRREMGR